jgi:hypothetical protein
MGECFATGEKFMFKVGCKNAVGKAVEKPGRTILCYATLRLNFD